MLHLDSLNRGTGKQPGLLPTIPPEVIGKQPGPLPSIPLGGIIGCGARAGGR